MTQLINSKKCIVKRRLWLQDSTLSLTLLISKEIAEGQYGDKIKPGALKSESLRLAFLGELVGEPIDGIQRADKSILRERKEALNR